MTSMADDVSAKAGKHWDKLESIFEERTAKAMKKLNVPSARDVEALKARIEELSAQVSRGARSAVKKTAAKTGVKSAAGKTAKRARKSAA
jgi:poly(hydroxyalkanoate) granule-associated protein